MRAEDPLNRISARHSGPATGQAYEGWRDAIWRGFCRLDVGPAKADRIDCRTEIARLHSVSMARPVGTSARFARTRELLNDGCADLVLISVTHGKVRVMQRSQTLELQAGQMCLVEMNVTGEADLTEVGAFTTARFPREVLMRVFPGVEAQLSRPLGQNVGVRALYDRYYELCHELAPMLDAASASASAFHLADLAGLLAGASTEHKQAACERGLPAARLEVLKDYIAKHLGDGPLTLDAMAKANGVSERQVQRLFAKVGTTFSDYVLERRLDLAHRLLLVGHSRKISDIAYAAGFGDLSYFNRSFRRHFGTTPSDARELASLDERGR